MQYTINKYDKRMWKETIDKWHTVKHIFTNRNVDMVLHLRISSNYGYLIFQNLIVSVAFFFLALVSLVHYLHVKASANVDLHIILDPLAKEGMLLPLMYVVYACLFPLHKGIARKKLC